MHAGGILPANLNPGASSALHFDEKTMPVTVELARDHHHGFSTSYFMTQQGFSAEVRCQPITSMSQPVGHQVINVTEILSFPGSLTASVLDVNCTGGIDPNSSKAKSPSCKTSAQLPIQHPQSHFPSLARGSYSVLCVMFNWMMELRAMVCTVFLKFP